MRILVEDYETRGIARRPDYPPEPVGVALRYDGRARYLSWGHPSGNNITKREAKRLLRDLRRRYVPLMHHAAFDLDVSETYLELALPREHHDTLVLAYLWDPRLRSLSLKPLAEYLLEEPPDERDELREWILANIPGAKKKTWGMYIADAPAEVVTPYAVGDVNRTWYLYRWLLPQIRELGMWDAYERERRVTLAKLRMERRGVPVSVKRLLRDGRQIERAVVRLSERSWKRIGQGEFNLDSPSQLAPALKKAKLVSRLPKTPAGNDSVSRDALAVACKDVRLVNMLSIRSVLSDYLSRYFIPWLDMLDTGDSARLYPSFNTVRSPDEYGRSYGTRTGRLSSNDPNFQGIAADVEDSRHGDLLRMVAAYLARGRYVKNFVGMRDYIVAPQGMRILTRDYNQQELRLLAHYEDGQMMRLYQREPWTDFHEAIRKFVAKNLGVIYPRKFIKIVVFAILYGRGLRNLAIQLSSEIEEARRVKRAVLSAMPGVRALDRELKRMGRAGETIRTWGGRVYECEEPRVIGGVRRTFEYKLLNLLIQGGAADITKQAMVNLDERVPDVVFPIIQVHDEIVALAENFDVLRSMRLMKEAMEDIELDVPMLTDGKISATTWARMRMEEVA